MKMRLDIGQEIISYLFVKLGKATARRPLLFILVPVVVSLGLATGLIQISLINDPEYLFPPKNARAHFEREIAERYFSTNYSHDYEEGRELRYYSLGRVIIDAKDGGSILRKNVFNDIIQLDRIIKNITVEVDGKPYQFRDLCARDLNNRCYENDLLTLKNDLDDINKDIYKVTYPLVLNKENWEFRFFGSCVGGVILTPEGFLKSAKVAALAYHLNSQDKTLNKVSRVWELAFLEAVKGAHFEDIVVARFVSSSLEAEFGNDTLHSMHYFALTVFIMLAFSVFTSMMSDCVLGKPWYGILGCVSSTMAVGASIGFCLYCGMEFITINFVIPFVMLGIGLDDTFVLLSAWRRTSRDKSVEERLCETYRHAGVSITITSLTNLTSFLVGSVTPFRAANILCAYMAVAIIFTYIYQITFFGGWMYYCGLAEEKNLHSLFFIRSQPKSLSKHRGLMYQLLLTGGRDSKNPYNEEDNKDHQGMVFFRDQVGEFLSKPRAKICIILVFFVYLTIAIYGCFQFQEGLEMYQIFGQNSYAHEFAKKEQEYFYEYLYRGQVMIYETLDYSDPAVQDRLENFMLALEANPRLGEGPVNESWLRYFKMFLNDKRTAFFTRQYNLTKKEDFIACLRNVFFKYPPAKRFMKDVVFNDNYTDIIATRYVFQAIDLHNTIDAKNLLASMWETIDESGYKAVVYHPMFLLVNTYIMVMPFTLQAIGITAVIMMIITFFFIPNITVAVWVAFSILSIECGVIGYMTLWGVNLNPTSLICLIICIGFSVDNSAHIAYAYVSSKDKNSNEKMKSALYFVGIPIIQACSSTLIGVLVIPFTPSYNFHVFFKTITLVMIFAGSHSLLLLPVLLSIFDKMFNKEQPTFGNNTHGAQDKLLTRYLPVEKKNTNSLIPNNNNS